ncbi:MAG: hypothetical protein ACJAYM_002072 [Flavobacteriales bacterium]|jgi:hypothetical protein
MVKLWKSFALFLIVFCGCAEDQPALNTAAIAVAHPIVSEDIQHFWQAYDQVFATNDTLIQHEIIQTIFIDSASAGQQRMMLARNYSVEDYLKSMKEHRSFWNSVRSTTQELQGFNAEIRKGVEAFRAIYPQLSTATVYYTMGTHRSPGTGVDSLVMIGTEFALGKSTTETSRLPEHLQSYYDINPVDHFKFLVIHEYVHTQQKGMVHNLLSLALYEGIADFVAEKVTGESSPFDAFTFGAKNGDLLRERFEADMFRPNIVYNWLWNSANNEFGTRDLGYFIGFSIAEGYYNQAKEKGKALAELIELEYEDEDQLEALVDASGYFSVSLDSLYSNYETSRPIVTKVEGIENLSLSVSPGRKTITLHFSEPMNTETRGFDFGPLGEAHVMRVEKVIGFSQDSTSFSFEVELAANQHYQSLVTNRFMSGKGLPMKAFLLDVETGAKETKE